MENLKEVVIVSGVRLPVGSFGGSLKDISAIDMGAMVVKEAVKRAGIEPSDAPWKSHAAAHHEGSGNPPLHLSKRFFRRLYGKCQKDISLRWIFQLRFPP